MSRTYFKSNFICYLKVLIGTFFGFSFVILLFDLLELLRITHDYSIKFFMLIKLALMKNYSSLSKVIPILVLVSSLIFFYIKNKDNEIIVAKSSGISNLGILLPVISVVLFFGVVNIFVINPIGTMLLKKYQNYEAQKFKKHLSLISVSKSGIWLRSMLEKDTVIISALRISEISNTMYDISIFFIDQGGRLQKQMSAKSILLREKDIVLENVFVIDKTFKVLNKNQVILPIKISLSQILESLTSTETISFFQLPEFIKITHNSGLSTTRYILHFLKEILSPFFLVSMVMISYFYCSHIVRKKRINFSILLCIITGFIVFFITNSIHVLGNSGKISVLLAALFPVITFNVLGLYLILHKKD